MLTQCINSVEYCYYTLSHTYTYTGDDKPDMRDLNRYIVEQQAGQWERLGLELGLKDYHIANISKDNPNRSVTCCREMIQKWLEIDTSATWGKLDDAINNIKLPSTTSTVSTDKGGNHGYYYSVLNY